MKGKRDHALVCCQGHEFINFYTRDRSTNYIPSTFCVPDNVELLSILPNDWLFIVSPPVSSMPLTLRRLEVCQSYLPPQGTSVLRLQTVNFLRCRRTLGAIIRWIPFVWVLAAKIWMLKARKRTEVHLNAQKRRIQNRYWFVATHAMWNSFSSFNISH